MKKLLSFFLAILILLSMTVPTMATEEIIVEDEALVEVVQDDAFPVQAEVAQVSAAPADEQVATSGQCGNNMFWSFDASSGTLTISGTGDMYAITNKWDDFGKGTYVYEPEWWSLPVRHVVVKEGVENLSDYAFAQSAKGKEDLLETVELPTSLKAIPEYGFIISTAITSLKIPEGIKSVTGWPFGEPDKSWLLLTDLYLPASLEKMDILTIYFSGAQFPSGQQTLRDVHFAGTKAQWNQIQHDRTAPMGGLMVITDAQYASFEKNFDTMKVTCSDDDPSFDFDTLVFYSNVDRIEAKSVKYYDGEKAQYPEIIVYYKDGTSSGVPESIPVSYSKPMPAVAGAYELEVIVGNCSDTVTVTVEHKIVKNDAKAPTCSADGWKAYETCEYCDYTTYQKIPSTGHSYTSKVTAPTCTAKGYTTHTCSCGATKKDTEVKALGHKMGSWTTTKAATCTATGTKRRDCSRCDYYETGTISKTAHKYTSKVVKPTATAKGYTLHTCACGNSYEDTYTPALNLSAPKVSISLNATTGKQVLTWKSGGDGISYQIYRASSKTGKYSKVGTAKTATWTDTSASVGKTYYYKVKAVYGDRSSSFSNIVSKAAVCATPDITVTLKKGKPYISWKKVTSAKKYDVYYATSQNGKYKKLTTTTSKSYTHSKASTGSQYFYKVRAVGSKSSYTGSYSAIESCWVTCVAPTVTASNDATNGYPILKWKAVTGAKQYDVYRRVAGKGKYVKIGSTTGKTYTDKSAVANTKYDYQVQTVGKKTQLNSPMSDKDTILCKVAAPVITVKLNAEGKPVISWKAVKGAKSYKVYRSTKATKSYKKLSGGKLDVKNGTYTDTTAAGGKTYYYKVVAVGSGNESGYSNYKKATAKCGVPAMTVKLTSNKPVLKWKKVDGAKKYEIQYSTDGKTFKKLTTTNKTSYTHKAKAGTYYYKIKALGSKSSYNSSFSTPIKAVVKK